MTKLSRAEQKALRPGQILEAAFDEFLEQGFKATRVEDIAKRVGVTKGTVYVYFPTKEDLFVAMIRHITLPLEAVPADFLNAQGTCVERLGALLRILYRRFMIAEGSRFPMDVERIHDDLMRPILQLVEALLEEGGHSGEFTAAAPTLASVVISPLLAVTVETLLVENRLDFDLPTYIEAHIELVTRGLLAGPGRS